ncbi:MAG: glycoside hydrolase family 3 C-terminal domain-containing protein [Bacilli bacterium]
MKKYEKYEEEVRSLTLKEKVKLLTGASAWSTGRIAEDLEPVKMCDGPHGLRKVTSGRKKELDISSTTDVAVCFPTASLTACSFDEELLYLLGDTIGKEALAKKIDLILGPGTNIKRSPLGGRNFEYFSEDPILSGKLSAAFIKGVQNNGVGTSLKHFCCNNQETKRFVYSAQINERALRDIYLKPFEIAIEESNPSTIMCSYNKVNGVQVSQNKYLLTNILRDEFKFKGLVVSDWGAVDSRASACASGLDLEMPGMKRPFSYFAKALKNGEFKEEDIEKSNDRLLKLIYDSNKKKDRKLETNYDKDHLLSSKIAAESMVLLKNDNNILPLNKKDNVLVIGNFAEKPRYQGNGSSRINPYHIDSFLDILAKDKINYQYVRPYDSKTHEINMVQKTKCLAYAEDYKKIIIFAALPGKFESEGYDRRNLNFSDLQTNFINEIAQINNNIVVVLQTGSPVILPFVNNVKGLLLSYLGGEATCLAAKDIIFGKVNPSGRLAETWPTCLENTPAFSSFRNDAENVYYDEDIYVGYRFYQTANIPSLFPFGHGLSYSTFVYSNYKVDKNDTEIIVNFTIKNTSKYDGKIVSLIFANKSKSETYRCGPELKAFNKIFLKGNEEKEVSIKFPIKYLNIYDEVLGKYIIEDGTYEIMLMENAEKEICKESINIEGVAVSQKNMTQLVRKEVQKYPFSMNSTFSDISRTLIGKIILKISLKVVNKMSDTDEMQMIKNSINDQPIRSAASFGLISYNRASAIVDIANKHYFKGLRKLIFNH